MELDDTCELEKDEELNMLLVEEAPGAEDDEGLYELDEPDKVLLEVDGTDEDNDETVADKSGELLLEVDVIDEDNVESVFDKEGIGLRVNGIDTEFDEDGVSNVKDVVEVLGERAWIGMENATALPGRPIASSKATRTPLLAAKLS